jgi:G3E family GTPase
MKRKEKFDAILVETTGLADPAPVAQTFFVDEDIAERTCLDAIVTVADAKFLNEQLARSHEAQEQVAFADIVLLNKIDLVTLEELARLEKRIRAMNPYARILRTERCRISLDKVMGKKAFDLKRVL